MKQPISLHGLPALCQILKSPDCMPSPETQSLPQGDRLIKILQPVEGSLEYCRDSKEMNCVRTELAQARV